MGGSLVLLLRGTVLLAFLAAMPVLALPMVGKQYDAWLLGELKTNSRDEMVPTVTEPAETAPVSVHRPAAPVASWPPEVQAEPDLPREPFAASGPLRRAIGQAKKSSPYRDDFKTWGRNTFDSNPSPERAWVIAFAAP